MLMVAAAFRNGLLHHEYTKSPGQTCSRAQIWQHVQQQRANFLPCSPPGDAPSKKSRRNSCCSRARAQKRTSTTRALGLRGGRRDRERTEGRQQGDKAAAGAGCEAHVPDFAVPPSSCCLRVMLRQQRRQCSVTNTLRDGSQPCASLQHCSTVTFQHSLTVCGAPATHPWPAARH